MQAHSIYKVESNPNMKRALESKIMEISHEKNLDLRALEAPMGDSKNGGMMGGRSLSDLLSSSLVLGAIVLKKSPVPGKYYLHAASPSSAPPSTKGSLFETHGAHKNNMHVAIL